MNPLARIFGRTTIRHHEHTHEGRDELQLLTECNDNYRAARRTEHRNRTRSSRLARRAAVRTSRRANRSAR